MIIAKKGVIIMLAASILFGVSTSVSALEVASNDHLPEAVIEPRFSYINDAQSTLSISGNTATVTGYVKMTANGTGIKMTTTLLCNGSSVGSWSTPTSTTSTSATIKKTVRLSKSGKYQVKTKYTVSGTDGSESSTCYSDTVNY